MTAQRSDLHLRQSIAAFYNDYHRGRERRADVWMQRNYWPAFVGRTLEFGGGTLLPAGAHSAEYCVIDLSPEAARRARRRGIPAFVADGAQAPFAARSFDTVACYDVLEHIVDPVAFLGEMARIARRRVVVAGPNYIGLHTGGMSRYLPLRLWSYLRGPGKSCPRLDDPYLRFDEQWLPDKDAIAAPNAGWVAAQLRRQSFRVIELRSWDYGFTYLNHVPAVRALGLFMFVVAERP